MDKIVQPQNMVVCVHKSYEHLEIMKDQLSLKKANTYIQNIEVK